MFSLPLAKKGIVWRASHLVPIAPPNGWRCCRPCQCLRSSSWWAWPWWTYPGWASNIKAPTRLTPRHSPLTPFRMPRCQTCTRACTHVWHGVAALPPGEVPHTALKFTHCCTGSWARRASSRWGRSRDLSRRGKRAWVHALGTCPGWYWRA
jgi:hypothetical protein